MSSQERMSGTILIVDDDPDFRLQERIQLEAVGFTVLEAETESEARRIFQERTPDLAIVDLMLENMDDGFMLCHFIKRKFPSVPVIMVSAVTSETGIGFDASTDEERSWIKADAFLSKPLRFEQMFREIKRLLADE
ncbi:MAG TPA: response regulator [bacterium]|nr:response regulator [bacterium]